MKLIFSLGLLFCISKASSREVILIDHIQNHETAALVKNILVNKFQLPDILIQINRQTTACSVATDAILHLCVLQNGELEIKKMNKYVLKSAFNVFFDQIEKE